MLSIKAKIVSSAKAAKRAATALPRKAVRAAKKLAAGVHPVRSSSTASTQPMAPTTKTHEAPAPVVASLEQANDDLRAANVHATGAALTAKDQVAALTAQVEEARATRDRLAAEKAQIERACQAIVKAQETEARAHKRTMECLAQRIKDARALTARRRADHDEMTASFISKCTALANTCDRLHRDNVLLEARIKTQEDGLDIQDRRLNVLKRSM